jgi:Tol biopolymer transport system component
MAPRLPSESMRWEMASPNPLCLHRAIASLLHTFPSAGIWRLDLQSSRDPEQFIASSSFRDVFPQYSPDGRRIAFYSNRTGLNQIWTCNSDGTQPVQLTLMTGTTTGTPRWSPDGKWISFDSNSRGNWQIYVVAAGGGMPLPRTSAEILSPDRRYLLFTQLDHIGSDPRLADNFN